jgi:hypothetical protein
MLEMLKGVVIVKCPQHYIYLHVQEVLIVSKLDDRIRLCDK